MVLTIPRLHCDQRLKGDAMNRFQRNLIDNKTLFLNPAKYALDASILSLQAINDLSFFLLSNTLIIPLPYPCPDLRPYSALTHPIFVPLAPAQLPSVTASKSPPAMGPPNIIHAYPTLVTPNAW